MFRYATDSRFPIKRGALHRFLVISVATLARPDAALDVSVDPKRGQWNAKAHILMLNPKGRRQTKKYRATVPVAWRAARWLDERAGPFVGVSSVRTVWEGMAEEVGLPGDGQVGMKLIRRSMAHLLRQRGVASEEVERMLGYRKLDSVSELYAPFDPDYCAGAKKAIEAVMDEIEGRVPGAVHRKDTGEEARIVPIAAAKKASNSLRRRP